MTQRTLERHYARLTGEERFRLIAAANARDDEVEIDRLIQSARVFTLRFGDYTPFMRAIEALAVRVQLELVIAAAEFLIALERSPDLAKVRAFVFSTKWAGWLAFCEQIGVPPDFMRSGYMPGSDLLHRALKLAEPFSFTEEETRRLIADYKPGPDEVTGTIHSTDRCADSLATAFHSRVSYERGEDGDYLTAPMVN